MTDSAEALTDAEGGECFAKEARGELGALIGDEVPGISEAGGGLSEEHGDVIGRRLLLEESDSQGESRKDIEDESELETKDSEESWDVGEVDEEDVVGEASPEEPFLGSGGALGQ